MINDQLKAEEGLRLKAYLCPAGKKTIGYGHNLESCPKFEGNQIPDEITEEVAEVLLQYDIDQTIMALNKYWLGFGKLSGARRDALINMTFQLGIKGILAFKKMHEAIMRQNWQNAYNEALASDWAKQTPERAKRVAGQLLTGVYYVHS